MSALEVGLVTALALLLILVAALLRAQAATGRHLQQLERRLNRVNRRPATAATGAQPSQDVALPAAAAVGGEPAEGDAVDIEGVAPDGTPVTVSLEVPEKPVLLVFLSTTCGICTSIWERLRDEGVTQAPGMRSVVVTKDAPPEDLDRIRTMGNPDRQLTVVLSTEAWIDYEVPGSPYVMVVDGRPGSVVDEGSVTGWDGLVGMIGRVLTQQP